MDYTKQSLNNLIKQIEEGYQKYQEVLKLVPESRINEKIVGNYNLKDIIAHIACWEQFCIDSLEGIRNKSIKIGKPNIKKINLVFYLKNKNKSLEDVKESAVKTHKELIDYLKKLDYQILSKPEPYYPDKNDIYTMITHCTTKHYPWAIKHVRKYIKTKRE